MRKEESAMKKKATQPVQKVDFESVVTSIVEIHQQAQEFATKAVNIGLTLRNWLIGRRIVEFEQKGLDRVTYGQQLLPELENKLASAGLKRVGTRELRRFRLYYTVYPQIRETVSPELLASVGASALELLLNFASPKKRETAAKISLTPKFNHH